MLGAMDNKKIKEFPEVDLKLQAPTKKSLFERQKAEQESKRLREEAETAAVYESFVKSFDDDDDGPGFTQQGVGGFAMRGGRAFGGGTPTGPGRGRGAFGSGPGSLGPPPMSLSKKRTHEGFQQQQPIRRDLDRGLLAFDDYDAGPAAPMRAFNTSDDEDEKRQEGRLAEQAAAKPTLRLANLPPGTSPAVIKALLPSNITVDAVRITPPTGPGTTSERKSMSAIVTLSAETPANDIDTTVNGLQNRYLGYGFYLSLHRHLSSAALSSVPVTGLTSGTSSNPFGAKAVNIDVGQPRHAPQIHGRGFAPPASYASTGSNQIGRNGPLLHVPVQPPQDVKELKLIHKTIELLLTHGPEFEALLMSRSEVQREEKWAWLWDARSTGGVWYRWRLWEVLTGSQNRRGQGKYLPLFEDSSAWKSPDHSLAFEYTTQLDEFVSDSEYNSSDDDESGDEGGRRNQHHANADPSDPSSLKNDDGLSYLNPLEKAKLTHLLARLPTTTARLRKGDVARVTAFAISHAGRGADEVVASIISNIETPFAYTSANPDRRKEKDQGGEDVSTPAAITEDEEKEDMSSGSLIGLYTISDILSSSSTSGVRHAWRYRQLFEAALRDRHVFENLGRLEKRMNWGRLRAEKWKRSVGNVLSLWEGWCVFPQQSHDHFVAVFNTPPLGKEEDKETKDGLMEGKRKNKWKAVEVSTVEDTAVLKPDAVSEEIMDDVDGEPMDDDEDVDGVPMEEDDEDGEPMTEDLDGEPMAEDGLHGEAIDDEYEPPPAEESPPGSKNTSLVTDGPTSSGLSRPPRRRPRAEDMFADSGSDGD